MPIAPVYGAPIYAKSASVVPPAVTAAPPATATPAPATQQPPANLPGAWLQPAFGRGGSVTSMGLVSYPQAPGTSPTDPTGGTGGEGGMTPYENAFNTFLDSTGYRFMFNQGQQGIENSAAARGLLNSGATGKALTQYGQDIGKKYFADYLGQLGNMNNTLGATASAGQNALGQIASAGTAGGGNAANAIIQGASNQGAAMQSAGNAIGNSISSAAGMFGNAFNRMFDSGGSGSFFGF